MCMEQVIQTLQNSVGESLPGVVMAFVYLIAGWIVAVFIKGVVRKACQMGNLNQKVNKTGGQLDLENGISAGAYYMVLLITLLMVFNQLNLEIASQPIQALVSQGLDFIPKLIGGGILIIVAWLAGTLVKKALIAGLTKTNLDSKVKTDKTKLSEAFGDVGYWLVFLLFLPGILDVFELQGLLEPAQGMVDKIMNAIPNVLAAVVIIFVGWFIAKILREIVTNLLVAASFDNLGEKIGIDQSTKLSSIAGLVVYFFTFIPAIISGLKVLEINAIAEPATQMLENVMAKIPDFLGAIAILVITFYIAKPVTHFISTLLKSANADDVPEKLGFKLGAKASLSNFAGQTVFFFMMLFAAVEAANRLDFNQFSELVATFIQFGGQVLLGSAIIAVGMWIAGLVSAAINKTQKDGHTPLADLIRVVILGLVIAMGLRAMGLANDIVNMAFGLTLGAAAIAFALSFGIGGREAAGKQMEHWLAQLRGEKK